MGAIGVVCVSLACSCSSSIARGDLAPSIRSKLDPALHRRLEELRQQGRSDQRLSVLVRTTSEAGPEQRRTLERFGMTIRSKSGTVISATIPAASIPDVAELDYVVRIELSKQLTPRGDQ